MMKFIKGMVVGGIVTAGVAMIYSETMMDGKKKMVRKSRQFARKIGIV